MSGIFIRGGIETIINCAKNLEDMTFHLVGGINDDIQFWKNYLKNLILKMFFYMVLFLR